MRQTLAKATDQALASRALSAVVGARRTSLTTGAEVVPGAYLLGFRHPDGDLVVLECSYFMVETGDPTDITVKGMAALANRLGRAIEDGDLREGEVAKLGTAVEAFVVKSATVDGYAPERYEVVVAVVTPEPGAINNGLAAMAAEAFAALVRQRELDRQEELTDE